MKRLILLVLVMFALFSAAAIAPAQAADKKMAISGGLGTTLPIGDMGDVVDIPILVLLASFQYAVMPSLSVEADSYYYLYAETEGAVSDYTQYQFGVGARYWLTTKWKPGKVYDGIYFGGGLARTKVEVETEVDFGPPLGTKKFKGDDTYNTLVLKGGYMFPLDQVLLDVGARYDIVDLDDLFDHGITFYAMAMFLF